jgi:PAS domain-containing protein
MVRKDIFIIIGSICVIVLFFNISAIVDSVLHPEIPYFDKEHLMVGGATGVMMILLIFFVTFYMRHLDKALKTNALLNKNRERVIAELKLTLSELETIYNSAPVGLCVFDTQLRFLRINQRMAELNGFDTFEHIGCSPRNLLPDMVDKVEEMRDRVV